MLFAIVVGHNVPEHADYSVKQIIMCTCPSKEDVRRGVGRPSRGVAGVDGFDSKGRKRRRPDATREL